ncbi:MAG TPA: hypothetical protein PLA50_04820, partial [Bacteroidia bacterium]|nr:hypothetical protein [Bacteroidia bacterium]
LSESPPLALPRDRWRAVGDGEDGGGVPEFFQALGAGPLAEGVDLRGGQRDSERRWLRASELILRQPRESLFLAFEVVAGEGGLTVILSRPPERVPRVEAR